MSRQRTNQGGSRRQTGEADACGQTGEADASRATDEGDSRASSTRQLDGKVTIVTGGGAGIGKAIARAFAAEGATVVLASRNRETLDDTAAMIRARGGLALSIATDITEEQSVVELFQKTVGQLARVDLLVNNAGVTESGPTEKMTLERWQHCVDVNLTGAFLCSREALKIMKTQRSGRIINIGSVSAQVPRPDSALYVATKFGLVGLTRSLALDGRRFGVSAGCLHPGNVATDIWLGDEHLVGSEPRMKPEELARVALAMAILPDQLTMLESIVLPIGQPYVGRG